MGMSTQPISFFDRNIKIRPHTASSLSYWDRNVTLGRFADRKAISLEQVLDGPNKGDYIARRFDGEFIQGPEV